MGVFRDFVDAFKEGYNGEGGKGSQARKGKAAVVSATKWGFPLRGAIEVGGDYENNLYVYDSSPLKGVRKGQVVTVETYCGDCRMVSSHTGMEWDSAEMGDVPVMYDSKIIGFTTIPREKVMKAAQLGYALRFKAKCYGMLEGYDGVKEMKIIAPRPFYLYGLVPGADDDRPDWVKEEYFKYNEYDEDEYKNIGTRDKWVFKNAVIKLIPTPEGSKAKPHIGVYSEEGMQISEVAAKNGYYDEMLGYMQKYSSFTVTATRAKSDMNEKVFYKIEILGK